MGTRGTLLLKATLDTKNVEASVRGLVTTVRRENGGIERENARSQAVFIAQSAKQQTTITTEIAKQDAARSKSAQAAAKADAEQSKAAAASCRADTERGKAARAFALEELARTRAAQAGAKAREKYVQDEDNALTASRARRKRDDDTLARYEFTSNRKSATDYIAYLKEEESAEKSSINRRLALRKQILALEKQNAPKPSVFANAVYSTRLNLPGGAAPLVGRSLAAMGLDLKEKSTLAIGTAISGVGTAVAAAGPVLAWLDQAAIKASNLNESVNKSEVIFKSSSKEIERWADTAVARIGQSKTSAIDAAAMFGNLFNASGMTLDQSAKTSEMVVERATDLSSLFNKSTSVTLEALQSGLQGQVRPLREFGVFLSDARIKAEAFAEGLGKVPPNAAKITEANKAVEIATAKAAEAQKKYGAGSTEVAAANLHLEKANNALEKALKGTKIELTEQQKIHARFQIIMKDSAVAAGDFGRTSGEVANKTRILTAQIDDLQAKIGKDFLPLKKDFLGFFSDALGVVSDLKDGIGNLVKGIEAADDKDFGMGPGIKRLFDNLSAVRELLHRNVEEAKLAESAPGRATDAPLLKRALADMRSGTLTPLQADEAQDVLVKRGIMKKGDRLAAADTNGVNRYVKAGENPLAPDFFEDAQARRTEAETLLMRGIVQSQKERNAYLKSSKTPGIEQASGDYTDYYRKTQENKRDAATIAKLAAPRNTGLYSGAGRNRDAAAAERARTREQKADEREKKKEAREAALQEKQARQASEKLGRTALRGQNETFKATLDALGKSSSPEQMELLALAARERSKLLKESEIVAGSKRYQDAKAANPKAALIGFVDAIQIANQAADKRDNEAIPKAKQKAVVAIAKAATATAKEAAKQLKLAEKQTKDDVDEYEERRKNYRSFLEADSESLELAQLHAKRMGQFGRAADLLHAFYDNRLRQITERYRDDLQGAGSDPNAINAAITRRDTESVKARLEANYAAADAITGGTFGSLHAGAEGAAGKLLHGAAGGEDNGKVLEATFADLGKTAADSFADYASRRFVEGPLSKFFDEQAAKLAAGGTDAGAAIAQGANALSVVVSLLAQKNSKKQGGGIFGGILGGILGFALGGPAGALTGFSAGAQAGQGNILGAALSLGTGLAGGFGLGAAKGGGGAGGFVGSGGTNPVLTGGTSLGYHFADGGYPVSGHRARMGEAGMELLFGGGRVSAVGVGGPVDYTPTGRSVVLPAGISRRLIAAAAGASSERGAGRNTETTRTIDAGIVNHFHAPVYDRMDAEIVARQQESKRRREALTE